MNLTKRARQIRPHAPAAYQRDILLFYSFLEIRARTHAMRLEIRVHAAKFAVLPALFYRATFSSILYLHDVLIVAIYGYPASYDGVLLFNLQKILPRTL